jgi:hypothetical protein
MTGARSFRLWLLLPAALLWLAPAASAFHITQIIDASGDGAGNPLDAPFGIAVDLSGNVYVSGTDSDNAFQITPGVTITEIIDASGDGAGNPLLGAVDIGVDSSGNVYVTGFSSDNAFQITVAPPTLPSLSPLGMAMLWSLLGLAGYRRLRAWRHREPRPGRSRR